ncbi:antitoxin Xre/MbcA/ParS toxin-binding domain-containing protein [Spirosoma aerophilum]
MKIKQHSDSQLTGRRAKRPVQIKLNGLDARLNQLAQQLGVTLKELAPLLQLSESTLHRLRRQNALSGSTAERVELLQQAIQHGLRVYAGDEQAWHEWLRYPLGELDGRTPLQTLTTIAGFTQVNDVLGRIEHGIFY